MHFIYTSYFIAREPLRSNFNYKLKVQMLMFHDNFKHRKGCWVINVLTYGMITISLTLRITTLLPEKSILTNRKCYICKTWQVLSGVIIVSNAVIGIFLECIELKRFQKELHIHL